MPRRLIADQNQLLLRIYELSRRFIDDMVVRRQDVEDVVHEVAELHLVKLRARRWHYRPLDFDLFVRRIVWNRLRDRRRSHGRSAKRDMLHFAAMEQAECEWSRADRFLDEAEIAALQAEILEQLPLQTRTAYALVRYEGMSHAQAAECLGVARGTLANYVTRAHRVFRDELVKRGLIDRRVFEKADRERRPPEQSSDEPARSIASAEQPALASVA